jgi:hypothetical protein
MRKNTLVLFTILFILLQSITVLYAASEMQGLLKKSDYQWAGYLPVDPVKRAEVIAARNLVLEDYHIIDYPTPFPFDLYSNCPYVQFTATDTVNVIPGSHTAILVAELDSLNSENLKQVTITLIRLAEFGVVASKTEDVKPSEWADSVAVVKNEKIEIENYTGEVSVKLVDFENTSINVNFVNGIGLLDVSSVAGMDEKLALNILFKLKHFSLFIHCMKGTNGKYKTATNYLNK